MITRLERQHIHVATYIWISLYAVTVDNLNYIIVEIILQKLRYRISTLGM